ncbi:Alpha/Beta hydrolase protein [Gymnopilus junonius]|uniref:Alpha/Beta hydrolase protein n=1 Tax=Gymnopilus junonius TaxID=109634 RepID=A0A9P5NT27_GYMJU|nr:Alpha/Beta hydrolase protein [Gymnopilus junonius]
MATATSIEERNKLSFLEKVKLATVILVYAPFALVWALLTSPFSPYGRAKSWKRILADKFLYTLVTNSNRRQVRLFFGTTPKNYNDFIKTKGLEPVEEANFKLFWIGPKRNDRVLLYLHGGGFLIHMLPPTPAFWRYIQEGLEERGKPTGLAILDFTLIPDALFPTQLEQTVAAIQHLLDSGVEPENIQLVGDSAGAALIHGVLMHLKHPLEGIPKLNLSAPFGGAFMFSLWARLVEKDGCLSANDGHGDFLNGRTLNYWGTSCMEGVPLAAVPYLEPNSAPEDWFEGCDKYVKRVLITAGEVEALRDEIVVYANTIKKHHNNVTLIVQENGIHFDPYLDFFVNEKKIGKLTFAILDWIAEGVLEVV